MLTNRYKNSILTVCLSFWLAWTTLIDFVVVPTAFRNIQSFFEAGNLGILLFKRLNSLEIVLATVVVILLAMVFRKNRKSLPLLIGGLLTFVITLIFSFWLTPKIEFLTELWKMSEAGKVIGIADIQQEHQFYHRLYVILDSIKIFILVLLLGFQIGKEEWTL